MKLQTELIWISDLFIVHISSDVFDSSNHVIPRPIRLRGGLQVINGSAEIFRQTRVNSKYNLIWVCFACVGFYQSLFEYTFANSQLVANTYITGHLLCVPEPKLFAFYNQPVLNFHLCLFFCLVTTDASLLLSYWYRSLDSGRNFCFFDFLWIMCCFVSGHVVLYFDSLQIFSYSEVSYILFYSCIDYGLTVLVTSSTSYNWFACGRPLKFPFPAIAASEARFSSSHNSLTVRPANVTRLSAHLTLLSEC